MDESYLYESKPQHISPKPMNMNEFLRDLGLENYYKNFKSQDISSTTELINQMTGNADYHLATTYGIGKSGHRKKILLAIEERKFNLSTTCTKELMYSARKSETGRAFQKILILR